MYRTLLYCAVVRVHCPKEGGPGGLGVGGWGLGEVLKHTQYHKLQYGCVIMVGPKLNLTAALDIVSFVGIWDPPSRFSGGPVSGDGGRRALKKREGKEEGIELN